GCGAGGGRGGRRRARRGGRGDRGRARRGCARRGSLRGGVSRRRAPPGGAVRGLGRARERLTKGPHGALFVSTASSTQPTTPVGEVWTAARNPRSERARRGNNFLPAVENRVRCGGYNGNVCSLLPARDSVVTGWWARMDTSLRDGLDPTP